MVEEGHFDSEKFWKAIERDRATARSFLKVAEELNAKGEVDAAESLWEEAIGLSPSLFFEHLGFQNRGDKLRLVYAVGLGDFFPQTEREIAELHRPLRVNHDFSAKDLMDFLRHQAEE